MESKINGKMFKRKTYFIEKKFQAGVILKFCFLVILGSILTTGIFYFFVLNSTTVSIVNSKAVAMGTADFMLPMLIKTLVISTIVVVSGAIFATLYISHRIAGALHRIKKTMYILGDGDYSGDFHVRRLDQLQDMASVFNSMIRKNRYQLTDLKANLISLSEQVDKLIEKDNKNPDLAEFKRLLTDINRVAGYFKTN